mgnify:CR=1 FL=1
MILDSRKSSDSHISMILDNRKSSDSHISMILDNRKSSDKSYFRDLRQQEIKW